MVKRVGVRKQELPFLANSYIECCFVLPLRSTMLVITVSSNDFETLAKLVKIHIEPKSPESVLVSAVSRNPRFDPPIQAD